MENAHESERSRGVSLDMLDRLSGTNDDDERKLWFDYIKTLNERQLQASLRAGLTTYVLLATAVGLIYRFGPHLPPFLAQPGDRKSSITVFALLVGVLSSVQMSVAGLVGYLGGEDEFRAVPKSREHALPVVVGICVVGFGALIALE